MPFHSPAFLLLFVATLALYYAYRTQTWQHAVLFLASFAFYVFAGLRDLGVLLGTVAVNYALSWLPPVRWAAALAVTFNLAVLAFFKYRLFIGSWFHGAPSFADAQAMVIPLGVSFYLFQLIAYQVDRVRGQVARESNPLRLLLYVLFFPHHQAGPIMRPAAFLPQFHGPKTFDARGFLRGVRFALYGLTLKVFADRIGHQVDFLFEVPPATATVAWTAALGFTLQIYGDFAGYSNMAVGFAWMLGYQMDRNFHQPYLAVSPSDFWRRWHVTLSAWLRDYLYIPLGGSRHGPVRTYLALLLTMALGGLWHGAAWNFVIWGALHGVLLCLYRLVPLERRWRLGSAVLFQLCVVLLWVPFRCRTVGQTTAIWQAMLGGTPLGPLSDVVRLGAGVAAFYVFHWLEEHLTGDGSHAAAWWRRWFRVPPEARGLAAAGILVANVLLLLTGTTFIYFRF